MRRDPILQSGRDNAGGAPHPDQKIPDLLDLRLSVEPSDEQAASERLQLFLKLVPALLAVHAIGGAILVALTATVIGASAAWIAAAPLIVMLGIDGALWWFGRRSVLGDRPPYLLTRIAAIGGLLIGLSWGSLFWIGGVEAGADHVVALFGTVLAVAVVSSAILSILPAAGIGYWCAFSVAAILAFTDPILAGASAAAAFCIASVGVSVARHRLAISRRQLEAEANARKANLLLNEFEEYGKGWFWETGPDGTLTYLSPQLARTLGRARDEMIGLPLTDLIMDGSLDDPDTPQAARTVGFQLSARLAFSDIVVRANTTGPPQWWSISGRPAFDAFDRFLGFRGVGTDLTEMRRSEAEVSRLARYDALTGLPNRVLMRQTLDSALIDVTRRNQKCALFLLDLDRFKSVNDTLGHPVGDALLRQVAERVTSMIGSRGRIGRLGGDEFKVVLPNFLDRKKLAALADRIIDYISRPYNIEGSTISIGASVGIAIAPDDGVCGDALIRNADLALYAAKAGGKGIHRFYEAAMHANAKERRLLETDLRKVLNEYGLELSFQPIVDAKTEAVVGFEALTRWNHPTRGYVSPTDFIPIAEEIGLIGQIGEWVLRSACTEAAKWPDHVRVAVNLSVLQFANPALPSLILNTLASTQLAPQRLELEITEGVFLNDSDQTDAMFASLQGIGVRLALDDFGTGYSSLGYLKKAPFNKIKIDQSFVRGAAVADSRNAAIIKAIVALADSLDMETTAEGVETHDELALIRELGCSQIQGYIFGKAVSAEEAFELVQGTGTLVPAGFVSSRAPRMTTFRSATMHLKGRILPVRIRNVSEWGALIETDIAISPQTRVEIEFSNGDIVAGETRWSQPGRFGMMFDTMFRLTGWNARRSSADPSGAEPARPAVTRVA